MCLSTQRMRLNSLTRKRWVLVATVVLENWVVCMQNEDRCKLAAEFLRTGPLFLQADVHNFRGQQLGRQRRTVAANGYFGILESWVTINSFCISNTTLVRATITVNSDNPAYSETVFKMSAIFNKKVSRMFPTCGILNQHTA